MSNSNEVVPVVRLSRGFGKAGDEICIDNVMLTDGSDSAYLYDPAVETPYEVDQSGSYVLRLPPAQARYICDRIAELLGE